MKTSKMFQGSLLLVTLLVSASVSAAPDSAQSDQGAGRKEIPHTNHEVQRGETLFGIAEKYYGNGYRWPVLLDYNPFVDPDHLIPGTTIFVPEPQRGAPTSNILRKEGSQKTTTRRNPVASVGLSGLRGGTLREFFSDASTATFLGHSLYKLIFFLFVWYVMHASVQGCFVWFGAHLSFVKDVNFKKAMRATIQSESLATVFICVVGFMGLVVLYIQTDPASKATLSTFLGTVEDYLDTNAKLGVAGVLLVGLYVFLGVRFVPQAFEIPASQGLAIVFVAVLIPHVVFLYVLSSKMGLIGGG